VTTGAYPAPGEGIGPYRVGTRIGGGAMGVVFEALDEDLHRAVALKVIAPHVAEDQGFRERFTREALAREALDSPHVASVYAVGEDDGWLWLVSQLVPDRDLGATLGRHGAPPVELALDLVAQLADGLADAHAAGLVHRDIKPTNVLLDRRESPFTAYLSDFGIASVGTPSYTAPELHTGGTADVRSDIYALGCVLWTCLTGRAPFRGTSDDEVVAAHREQPVPQLPGDAPLSTGANDVLRRAMAKDPEERFQSAAAMRDELRSLVAAGAQADAPPSAPPGPAWAAVSSEAPLPPELAEAARSSTQPIALVVGALVLVLLLAAGVAYRLVRDDDGTPAGAGTDPTTSAPTSPGQTTATPPTASGYTVKKGDEEKAVASFATALVDQLDINQEQAECLAFQVIRGVGLQRMVDIGMFDAEMKFLDADLAAYPDVKDAIATAAVTCVRPA
jgi:serine/threonine protein kinase